VLLTDGFPTWPTIFLDDSRIYASSGGSVYALPKTGGTRTTLVASTSATAYAADDEFVYYVDGGSLRRVPKAGGTPLTLSAVTPGKVTSIAVDDNMIYWTESGGEPGRILVVSKPDTSPPVVLDAR